MRKLLESKWTKVYPKIWNFLDSSNSKNSNFLRFFNRLPAFADTELLVYIFQVAFDGFIRDE
jgi:hypothetical protein